MLQTLWKENFRLFCSLTLSGLQSAIITIQWSATIYVRYFRLFLLPCTLNLSEDFPSIRLPYPFVNATQCPCSVVLRSSHGDFLSNFQNSVNLHIALTDSCGSIVEFDSPGLLWTPARNVDKAQWRQCVLIMQVPEAWYAEWDQTLRNVIDQEGWRRKQYDEDHVNCYSFVLDFLRHLQYEDTSQFVHDR